MTRIPLVDPKQAPDATREVLENAHLSLFGMVAHADSAFRPWLRYGAVLLTQLELDPLLRELAILQVAHLVNSPYEWVQHVVITREVGGSDAQIKAIEHDREADESLTEEQQAMLSFAREVIVDGAASEAAAKDMAARVGERGVVELLLVIGHYMAIARLIATTGLEPETPVGLALTDRAPSLSDRAG
jgi:4-carboxymuconolactone decarboxylase